MPARRTSRFRPPPLAQREGLDAVRVVFRPVEVGLAVREVLAARFPALTSAKARSLDERLRLGEFVDQDGCAWKADDLAERGREMFFHRELAPESVEPVHVPTIYEDEHLLVVAKPRDMASIPRGEHVRRSALVRLRVASGNPFLSPIHRLDKQTGGILVLSKVPEERGAYQTMFASRLIEKRYIAVVADGGSDRSRAALKVLNTGPLEIREPIAKDHGDLWAYIDPRGKEAWTTVCLADPAEQARAFSCEPLQGEGAAAADSGGNRYLLQLTPHTGRTHQLRVHLAHVGLPIVGDELYPHPPADPVTGERQRCPQDEPLALWSVYMSFTDPLTGQHRAFEWDPFEWDRSEPGPVDSGPVGLGLVEWDRFESGRSGANSSGTDSSGVDSSGVDSSGVDPFGLDLSEGHPLEEDRT